MAKKNVDFRINTIMEYAEADSVLIALSCPGRRYWRHDILPDYKGQRAKSSPPVALADVKNYMRSELKAVSRDNLEADDVLGILATKPNLGAVPIIVTSDKDLLQIPGLHLNHKKLSLGVTAVSEEEGDLFHLMQTLTGDTVDNYKGCPGIGPVKATEILRCPTAQRWGSLVSAFKSKDLTEEDALIQARVARIVRWDDWDYEKQRVKLWNPHRKKRR
jgi:DNA polymerase-1